MLSARLPYKVADTTETPAMPELVDFPTPAGLRSLSPFGYKAEALLALSGTDYTKIPPAPDLMPHDKIPVLREDDRLIPDSSLIQHHLEDSGRLTCDSSLTLQERAIAEAFRRMAEEHLRWVLAYTRWMEPACEAVMSSLAFGHLDEPARRETFLAVRGEVKHTLHAQGLGRHTPDDLYRFGCDDLDAIAVWLDDKPFFMGDRPTSVDATIAGLLYALLCLEVDTPLIRHTRAIPTFAAYVVRFEQTVFPGATQIPAHLATLAETTA